MLNNYYCADNCLTQHFPLFYVFFCMKIIKIGIYIGNNNIGLFLLTIIHMLSMLVAFSAVFIYLKKWNINFKYRFLVLMFYCINPIFLNYSTTIYHDVIYSSFILLYILLLTDFIKNRKMNLKKILIFTILSCLICYTRKNGIIIVLPINILLLLNAKDCNFKFIIILPIILFFATEYSFSKKYFKYSEFEMMAIPIQTLSRYSKYYNDDITLDEKETINKVIDYDNAGKYYNPILVDDVRNNFGNYFMSKEELKNFLKVWVKLFFRHPGTYISAVINTSYQLYYPYEKTTYMFYELMAEKDYFSYIPFYEIESLQKYKKILYKIYYDFENIPIIQYLDDPGFYSWFFIIVLCFVLSKRLNIIPMLPLIITFVICIAGPTMNYHTRYAFPIIFSILPLYAFYNYLYYDNINNRSDRYEVD